MSLVSLAIQKQLPPHQFMDVETLEWIKQNKPFKVGISTLDNTILRESVRQARNFIPCSDWFPISPIRNPTVHVKYGHGKNNEDNYSMGAVSTKNSQDPYL